MRKTLVIFLVLMLSLGLISVPGFAEQAELNLKYWHAGVGGAELWIGDYEAYKAVPEEDEPGELSCLGVHLLNGVLPELELVNKGKLMLQFGAGKGFIVSGSYSLFSTVSLGVSYWGLSRADEVTKALDNPGAECEDEGDGWIDRWSNRYYALTLPWLADGENEYQSEYWERRYTDDDYWGYNSEGLITGEGALSMSALDVSGTKALSGASWELGLLGGIRRVVFNQDQSIGFVELEEGWDKELPEYDHLYWATKYVTGFDSALSVNALGPQVGIEGTFALGDKLLMKAGAKAGFLFGTSETRAKITGRVWHYAPAISDEWLLRDDEGFEDEYPLSKDAIRISTYDLSFDLVYHITDQLSIEAGYYTSVWNDIPSLVQARFDGILDEPGATTTLNGGYLIPIVVWEQPKPRAVTIGGLTVGLNVRF